MSLPEALMALAVVAIVGGGIAALVANMGSLQRTSSAKSEVNDFVSSLQEWLSGDGCLSALQGRVLSTTPVPISFSGFSGFGLNAAAISSGFQMPNMWRLRSITLSQNVSVPDAAVNLNGLMTRRRIARIEMDFDVINNSGVGDQSIRRRFIELPVLVDGGNTIVSCDVQFEPATVCADSGGVWDSATGRCNPQVSCHSGDSFIADYQSPPMYPSRTRYNQLTGGLSCPAGHTAYLSTYNHSTFTYSCGKKCTATGNRWVYHYVCMKCG